MIIRDCECLACGEEFAWPVKQSADTQNISGEATIHCPKCGKSSVAAGPHIELRFERVTCSRCGGTGQYSYHAMYGTRCFKCGGGKEVYTKRGAAASQYLDSLRKRRFDQLKVGDWFREMGITMGGSPYTAWFQVTEIETGVRSGSAPVVDGVPQWRDDCITLKAKRAKSTEVTQFTGWNPEHEVVVQLPQQEQIRTLRAAIEYQNSLTQQGKPAKRPRRA